VMEPGAVTDGVIKVFPVPCELPPFGFTYQLSVPPAHPPAFNVMGPVPQRSLSNAKGGAVELITTGTELGRLGQPFTVTTTV
jgi:hypothetical protein